jgi:hypothetical protein
MAAPIRQISDLPRSTTSGPSIARTPALDLNMIVQGVLENWDNIEESLPPRITPSRPVEESSRQAAVENHRPRPEEKNDKKFDTQPVEAEEFAMLGPGVPPLGIAAPKAAAKGEDKDKAAAAKKEEAAPEKAEATHAAAPKAAEQAPRQDGQVVPLSFAIPNHSAGASGFGNTWSHAAKQSGGGGGNSQDNVIHSE